MPAHVLSLNIWFIDSWFFSI